MATSSTVSSQQQPSTEKTSTEHHEEVERSRQSKHDDRDLSLICDESVLVTEEDVRFAPPSFTPLRCGEERVLLTMIFQLEQAHLPED